ncbi:MAG: chemotaxis protein CheA [Bacteroidota bacterium]|nr:chemotaxis protein CheA [Bacteroidota bacterium]
MIENFKKKFVEEATEHILDIEQALLFLEQNPNNKPLIERVFRAMHTLKGSGAMFGFEKISEFTHNLETVYDLVRNDELAITSDLLNLTLASVDHLNALLKDDDSSNPLVMQQHQNLIRQIDEFAKGDNSPDIAQKDENIVSESKGNNKTFHVLFQPNEDIMNNGTNPLFLLDELHSLGDCLVLPVVNKIPELVEFDPNKCFTSWEIILSTSSDINAISDVFIFVEDECTLQVNTLANYNLLKNNLFTEKIKEFKLHGEEIGLSRLQDFISTLAAPETKLDGAGREEKVPSKEQTISSIRVASDKLDQLMNLVSELVTTQARLSLFAENEGSPELMAIAENVQKLSRQLRDNAFSIVLIPIENMLTRFQRLVRDLSRELKKDIVFMAEGTDTELDKTIIENLTDPLMHILRNSLDHGIELPAARIAKGKPAQGKIILKAFYSGANVIIQVFDDGAGIDPNIIRTKAIQKNLITTDTPLTRKEILDMIFVPGFSTAANVTDVSGRGVGMDVVKRKIADIRGEVEVESEVNIGTTLTIKLPLTLSIIDGLLVKIDDTFYVIPLSVIDKIYAVEHQKLARAFNNTVVLDGEQLPFFMLRDEFGLPDNNASHDQVIIVRYEDKRVGFAVDNVVGEYQAVLKPLGKHYKRQEIISGATILGDGTIALVMDTNKAIKFFAYKNTLNTED